MRLLVLLGCSSVWSHLAAGSSAAAGLCDGSVAEGDKAHGREPQPLTVAQAGAARRPCQRARWAWQTWILLEISQLWVSSGRTGQP